MRVSSAVLSLVLVTLVYLGALIWVDTRGGVLRLLPDLLGVLGLLTAVAIASWTVRFCRWHWLTRRAGVSPPVPRAFLAYLSGFSFTATPGKVGELIRIRYLQPLGVPPRLVIGLFIYERCLDLLVVLLLAMLAFRQFERFWPAALFVVLVVGTVLVTAANPGWLRTLAGMLQRRRLGRLPTAIRVLAGGLDDARQWMNCTDLLVSIGLGGIAWFLLAASFVWLLGRLGVDGEMPILTALAIYPLAMLAGAASMIPGGLGSTEAAIVVLLVLNGVTAETATLAAVGARLSSLWAAILFGLISLSISEACRKREAGG